MARGHLRKRSADTWTLVIELGRDDSGKRKQKWVTFKGGKKAAEKELSRLVVEADGGTLMTSRLTLAEFAERWLADHASANVAPKTYARYAGLLRQHVVPHLGRITLEKLTPAHIVQLHAKLRQTSCANKDGLLSPTTIRHVHRVLHTALGHAVKWRLISINPASSVDAPSPARSEMRCYDAGEAARFLETSTSEGIRWQAFFAIAMSTGLRLGEMIGLRWQDVDLQTGTLVVRQTIQRVPKIGIVVKAPKTATSRRPVALGKAIVTLLRQHRIVQNETRLQLGSFWQDRDLVFPSELGTPLEDKAVRRAYDRICKLADVPKIRIHDLRHTTATLLLTTNVHPKIVSERLGHSTSAITLQTYSHVAPTLQQAAAEILDTLLFPALAKR